MTLQRTQLIGITSITGNNIVGIFTAGVTPTAVGIASTSYIRSVMMHNTGLGTARVSLYVNPNHTPVQTGFGITSQRILRVDLASNETTFFETNYPIVLVPNDSITGQVSAPDSGGVGVGSMVNFIVNGDTDITF
tara:strand:+ start:1113 stop:1517 length:405 start_codon:yes stop_codon:yes gene_type:complete